MRNRRRFRPGLESCEARQLLTEYLTGIIPLDVIANLWPQSKIVLTDETGAIHPVTDGATLVQGLKDIQAGGHRIGQLIIKGHGDVSQIHLDNDLRPENILQMSSPGRILLGSDDVTGLFKGTARPGSRIVLAGCGTSPMAQGMSLLLPDVEVTGYDGSGLGIPGTTAVMGADKTWKNGKLVTKFNPNDFDNMKA